MKVGKEEIVGMVTALELYLGKTAKEEQVLWDGMLSHIQESIEDIPGVKVWRKPKLRPTRDVPILVVELEEGARVDARIDEVDGNNPESIKVGMPLTVKFLHKEAEEGPKTTLAFKPA